MQAATELEYRVELLNKCAAVAVPQHAAAVAATCYLGWKN